MSQQHSLLGKWASLVPLKNQQLWRGLERWLGSLEHCLFLQRTGVRFPAPTQWITTAYKLCPRESDAQLWPLQGRETQAVNRRTRRQNLYVRALVVYFKTEKVSSLMNHTCYWQSRYKDSCPMTCPQWDKPATHLCFCFYICKWRFYKDDQGRLTDSALPWRYTVLLA